VAVIPFSKALRERTWSGHGDSEGAAFMSDLMTGKGTREDYIALVAQHYFVYEALETAAAVFADDPEAAPFLSDQLTRLPALEADLTFLLGDGWRDAIAPLPTTVRYVDRITGIAADRWAGGFVAHHYTRYLGDLSGGQASAASCSASSVSRPTAWASTSSIRSPARRPSRTPTACSSTP
jgi:heme oxygenase